MGASIRNVLAESVLGPGTALDWESVNRHLKEMVNDPAEKARVADHRERQEFYMDVGHASMNELIECVLKQQVTQDLRKEWVHAAGFNNVTRRIINAQSTVYQDPALRTVDPKANNKKYQVAQQVFSMPERSRQWNRLSNLHRTLLVGARVRNVGSQSSPVLQPRLDIVTPAQTRLLITNPKDPTIIEGAVIELGSKATGKNAPHSVLWTNAEKGYLNKDGELIATPEEHPFDRMPFSLLRLDDDTNSLWSTFGRSLVAAHKAEWFAEVCLLKETKSATKQPILAGDLANVEHGQVSDSESAIKLPDGVAHSVVDMSMDLSMFRDTGNHIVDTIASSFGIAPSILRHEGVQSAAARDLMRVPLRELRLEQQSPLREFERDLAEVQSMVLAEDMPDLAFDTTGWRIDFADPQTPRSEKEQLEEFEHSRRLRLTSTIKNVMRGNPDLTREQAEQEIQENITDELWFHMMQRPFQALTGAEFGGDTTTATPAETGDPTTSDDDSNGRAVPPTLMGE